MVLPRRNHGVLMIINLNRPHNQVYVAVLRMYAHMFGDYYNISKDDAIDYCLRDISATVDHCGGNEFAKWLRLHDYLDIHPWVLRNSSDKHIAFGFDITEDSRLTAALLKVEL